MHIKHVLKELVANDSCFLLQTFDAFGISCRRADHLGAECTDVPVLTIEVLIKQRYIYIFIYL